MPSRRQPERPSRRYPRSARVNEVLREVLADEIRRAAEGDDRLTLLTVTGVETDPDLRHARVLFASLDEDQLAALRGHRVRLQAELAHQVTLKRTPQLSFVVDPAVSSGQRVEDLLRQIRETAQHGDGEGHVGG